MKAIFYRFFNEAKTLLITAFKGFLSLIYKENCCICGCSKDNEILCKNCAKDVEILSGFAQRVIRGVKIYSACVYGGTVRKLIHKLKFNHKKAVAGVLAEILHKYYKKVPEFENLQNTLLVPVPTSKRNMNNRGYNNVYEIAKAFSALSNIKILNNFLIKTKNTKPQYKTGKNKRRENIYG